MSAVVERNMASPGVRRVDDIDVLLRNLSALPEANDRVQWTTRALSRIDDPRDRALFRGLVRDISAEGGGPLTRPYFERLALVPAMAGDWDTVLALMARLEPSDANARATRRVLTTLGGATGAHDLVVEQVAALGPHTARWTLDERRHLLWLAITAALGAGRDDVATLIDRLPPEHQTLALVEWGRAAVATENLDLGQTLLAQAQEAGADTETLQKDLARALAEAGDTALALAILGPTTDLRLVAQIAVHAPR